jgi:hypothetical protein
VVDGEVVDTAGIQAATAPDHEEVTGDTTAAGVAGAAVEDTLRAFVRSRPRRARVPLAG